MTDEVVAPSDAALLKAWAAGTLSSQVIGAFDNLPSDQLKEIGRRCAALHNAGRIDLLEVGAKCLILGPHHALSSADRFLTGAIPEIDTSPEAMSEFVRSWLDGCGEKYSGILGAFLNWCRVSPGRAQIVVSALRAIGEVGSPRMRAALAAVTDLDVFKDFIDAGGEERLTAVEVLGWIASDPGSCGKALSLLRPLLAPDVDDGLRASAIYSAARTVDQAGVEPDLYFLPMLQAALVGAGPRTVAQFSTILFVLERLRTDKVVAAVLECLAGWQPEAAGSAIDDLDHALASLAFTEDNDPAVSFLPKFLESSDHQLTLDDFRDFCHALKVGPSSRFHRAVVSWLMSGPPRLCKELTHLTGTQDLEGIVLVPELARYDLDTEQLAFLGRKAVAHLFTQPLTATSLLVAILRVQSGQSESTAALLVNPMLINFPGSVRKYLQGLEASDPAYPWVQKALSQANKYEAALMTVGELKEMRIPESHLLVRRRIQKEEARRIQKGAHEKSIFKDLFTTVTLLHGRSSRTFVKRSHGMREPMDMSLHSHGITWEMPRIDTVDPIGLNNFIFRLRIEKPPR